MYRVTSRFLSELTRDHTAVTYAEVWRGATQIRGLDGLPLVLRPVSGSVQVNAHDPIRRTLSATFAIYDDAGTALVPVADTDPLMPYGVELRVYRGLHYPTPNLELAGDTTEVVPLGRFRLTRVNIADEDGAIAIEVEGMDAAYILQQSLTSPLVVPVGTEAGLAFQTIVNQVDPSIEVNALVTRFTLPSNLVVGVEDDPWAKARQVASSAGCEAFIDSTGVAIMRVAVTKAAPTALWDLTEGDGATFHRPRRMLDMDRVPNLVTVVGNSGGSAGSVRAQVWDDDPKSPTYLGGPYKTVSKTIRTELVNTVDQATEMATTDLAMGLAGFESVECEAVCNPALEVGDTVSVTRVRIGLSHRNTVIEHLSMPLMANDTMGMTLRRVVVSDSDQAPVGS